MELFDLTADPYELNNIYGQPEHEQTTSDLVHALTELRKSMGDDDPAGSIG